VLEIGFPIEPIPEGVAGAHGVAASERGVSVGPYPLIRHVLGGVQGRGARDAVTNVTASKQLAQGPEAFGVLFDHQVKETRVSQSVVTPCLRTRGPAPRVTKTPAASARAASV